VQAKAQPIDPEQAPAPEESRATAVARDLREAIVEGRLQPNERIKQDAVAKRLGVSRLPVREALRELASEGLVTLERDVGARVTSLDPRELVEVYLLREAIEPMMVAQAAHRITDAELAAAWETNSASEPFAETGDTIPYLVHDREFHWALLEAARLPRAMAVVQSLWRTGERYRVIVSMIPHRLELSVVEHRLILEALERRSPDDVGELYRVHIRRTRETLSQHQELFPDGGPG
jgi:GntR family transcriptional regulator, rspAB operon transcriptional repressor